MCTQLRRNRNWRLVVLRGVVGRRTDGKGVWRSVCSISGRSRELEFDGERNLGANGGEWAFVGFGRAGCAERKGAVFCGREGGEKDLTDILPPISKSILIDVVGDGREDGGYSGS
ncbi:hypothetical protein Tco_1093584 [Tanacetum coccineum]|uniref:Uncharacterized protein n=1 Tax=Tanacetum coccineum TaxID=301880 RepID=A0ABQ5IEB3_9ASTR